MKSPTPGQDAEASWQEIGFHRPLAGILFNLVFVFIAAGFGIVFAVWFIPNIVFPFASEPPEGNLLPAILHMVPDDKRALSSNRYLDLGDLFCTRVKFGICSLVFSYL